VGSITGLATTVARQQLIFCRYGTDDKAVGRHPRRRCRCDGVRAWRRFSLVMEQFHDCDLRIRVVRLADTLPEAALARSLCRGRFFCGQGFASM
jgi:hypothetical protein